MPHPLILLVEDNPGEVMLWEEALGAAGIVRDASVDAEPGQAALDSLDELARSGGLMQLLVPDARLPGMGGDTPAEHLYTLDVTDQASFVIMSGLPPPRYQQHGANWFQKPQDFDGLCTCAWNLCASLLRPSPSPPTVQPSRPTP